MVYDLSLLAYLLDSNSKRYSIEFLIQKYIDPLFDIQKNESDLYFYIYKLKDVLWKEIQKLHLEKVYNEIELPLVEVLNDMEIIGIKIDKEKLNTLALEISQEIQDISDQIFSISGNVFNINSPKQIQEVLFDKLNIPHTKKIKRGYSTDSDSLYDIGKDFPIVSLILKYREYSKLLNTYIQSLPTYTDKDSRIHTTFNQIATATGRLSSLSPNLQNIPIKGEYGKYIRSCFIANKGYKLISIDYSQIELRVLASLSNDIDMIEAFKNGRDIHAETATKIFDKNININANISNDDRRQIAKTVNFGIIYGQTPFGLSRQLGISKSDAEIFINKYFEEFRNVKIYMSNIINECKQNGYIKTISGRMRYIPQINDRNKNIEEMSKRETVNTAIQGSSADIIKLAMIEVHRYLKKQDAYIVLQIHDELLIEVIEKDAHQIAHDIAKIMECISQKNNINFEILVPLKVDVHIGDHW